MKANLDHHLEMLSFAKSFEVDFILFPELSFTAYEPPIAKNKTGTKKAKARWTHLAEKHALPTMMRNNVGLMEDGPGHGELGIWGKRGASLGFLDHKQEGILIWDTGAHDQALTFEIPQ